MMTEEYTENGHVSDQEEPVSPHPDINSPRQSMVEPLGGAVKPPGGVAAMANGGGSGENGEDSIEFFGQKGGVSESGGSEGEESPRTPQDKDNTSFHSRPYVTVSISPDPPDADSVRSRADMLSVSDSAHGDVVKPKPRPRTKCMSRWGGATGGGGAEEEGQDRDLKVTIEERDKESDAFITYKVCTQSTRSSSHLEKGSYTVWRRYRDFEWLRDMLEKHNPTLIVPPLPGKQLARYFDQKSEEFLDERQRALTKFLKRLSAHPYFSFDVHLMKFITAEPDDFAAYVAETSGSSSRLLSSVTAGVKMAANTFRLKNPDPEYAKQAKYFEELCEKMGVIERVAARLHTEREELMANQGEFSSALMEWSLNEPQLVNPIRAMGTCVENCSSALHTLNANNACTVMTSAKEYQLYCISGVSAVRRRDGLQLEKERASEERLRKKKIHDDAAKAEKLQKLPKLAEELEKSVVEADRTLDNLAIANEKLRVDIEKWKEAKDQEISNLCCTFADNHINYHQKCFNEWEKVLAMLRDSKVPPGSRRKDVGAGTSTALEEEEEEEEACGEITPPEETSGETTPPDNTGGEAAPPKDEEEASVKTAPPKTSEADFERSDSSPDLFT